MPDKTALGDVDVTLNGADVTSAFGPDPEGNHQLEGVVTGLPLGKSTIVARSQPKAKGNKHYDELTLTNNPLQGPIFSGPHQQVFLCATAAHAAEQRPAADPAVADLRDADGRLVRLPEHGRQRSCPTTRPHRRRQRRSSRRRRWTARRCR